MITSGPLKCLAGVGAGEGATELVLFRMAPISDISDTSKNTRLTSMNYVGLTKQSAREKGNTGE